VHVGRSLVCRSITVAFQACPVVSVGNTVMHPRGLVVNLGRRSVCLVRPLSRLIGVLSGQVGTSAARRLTPRAISTPAIQLFDPFGGVVSARLHPSTLDRLKEERAYG
jgi:hypothetical protein